MSAISKLKKRLFEPVDTASLVYFRIAFGVLMASEALWMVSMGWIDKYTNTRMLYKYYGFEWVQPWPGIGMYVHYGVLVILALGIALGWRQRLCAALFFVSFAYVFLLDQALYLNHHYLYLLVSFLLIFVPANRCLSLDARRDPSIRSSHVATWALWLIRFQIAVPYFFGGIAKIKVDWLGGEPMRSWMWEKADWPVIGPLLSKEPVVYFFAWNGMFFDLLIAPAILWHRTRWYAVACVVFFNIWNAHFFAIGTFPWVMLGATLILLPPSWPRWVLGKLGVTAFGLNKLVTLPAAPKSWRATTSRQVVFSLICFWVALQVLVPFRYLLYPDNPSWSKEGYRFSWRMKLDRSIGNVGVLVRSDTNPEERQVDLNAYVRGYQVFKGAVSYPDMMLQLCHRIADDMRAAGKKTST